MGQDFKDIGINDALFLVGLNPVAFDSFELGIIKPNKGVICSFNVTFTPESKQSKEEIILILRSIQPHIIMCEKSFYKAVRERNSELIRKLARQNEKDQDTSNWSKELIEAVKKHRERKKKFLEEMKEILKDWT